MAGPFSTKLFCLCFASLLGGCGVHVPEIQEFWGNENDVGTKINAITNQIECELREGVREVIADDEHRAAKYHVPKKLEWLKGWGAQLTIFLTIEEKSTVAPSLSTISPFVNAMQTFTFGLGANASADATRIDKINVFYKLSDFLGKPPADPRHPCIPDEQTPGTVFLESDLKLRQWLRAATYIQYTGAGDFAAARVDKDVISHEVKFDIVSEGSVTPAWKLVRINANTGSMPFFDTKRDRTQDLIVTMGPLAPTAQSGPSPALATTPVRPSLSTAAQNAALASEIGASIAAAIRILPSSN